MRLYVNLKTGTVSIGAELTALEASDVGAFLEEVSEFGGHSELKHVAGAAEKIMDAFAEAAASNVENFVALQAALNTYDNGALFPTPPDTSKLAEIAMYIPTVAGLRLRESARSKRK